MITEVSIRCQKTPKVGIRRIPAYTPPIHHCTIPFTNKAGVIRNLEPQNCTPNFSPVAYPILLIFSEFEDPLKVYQCQPKFPLNLLPVLYTNIGKFVLEIPETHLPSEFRVKNRCIQFLGQKCKIGAVLAWSDIWTPLKSMETLNLISARDSPRGSTEIGYAHAYGSLATFQLCSSSRFGDMGAQFSIRMH